MTKVDQFESAFRSADKAVYAHERPPISTVLVVTDLAEYEATQYGEQIKQFLAVLPGERTSWRTVSGTEFTTIRELLDIVEAEKPDLICTYRHLHTEGWRWGFTLGDHVEVLTQATTTPVLLAPHPGQENLSPHILKNTSAVMAMTDHLTGDDRLVNFAATFTEAGGALYLAHVEDTATYDRYIDVISKIDVLDTDTARERIEAQLLKEPRDFTGSCSAGLQAHGIDIHVHEVVTMGHHLHEYRRLIEQHEIDLLVFNTKDDDQLAMHGLAYPLAVELHAIPLLLL